MKRLLSILITMCMTFLFVPSIVYAESYSLTETQELQHLIDDALSTDSLLVLEKDYTITEALSIPASLTLDLNGHVIRMDERYADQHQIIVSNVNLILIDSRPEAEHTGDYAGLPAGGVITGTRGDGTIPGHHFAGGGITANYLVMNGGTIYDCRGSLGGAVSAFVFEMNGGSIVNCHAKDKGGAIAIASSPFAKLIINGGTIENCTAQDLENSSIYLSENATMSVARDVIIDDIVSLEGKIVKEGDYDLVFTDTVYNRGTIQYGTYYGGIVNLDNGSVSNTCYTVSFDVNGGSSTPPVTQWFVNVNGKPAKQPADPVNGNYTFMGWYEGDTLYDFNSAVDHNIVLKAMWKDTDDPVITGIEDGKTYCNTIQFEVSDNIGVSSVTVNDQPVTPDANGKYTLTAGIGVAKIVVEDAEQNRTVKNVTVNATHTYDWVKENGEYWKECIYCGDALEKYHAPVVTISVPEEVCRTQNTQISAIIPEDAVSPTLSYEFERIGNNVDVTAENGKLEGVVNSTAYPASENSIKVVLRFTIPETGYVYRTEKVILIEEHTGGTATCISKAVCARCGQEYGEVNPDNHISLIHFPSKAATVASTGNFEFWQCEDCENYYSDEQGKHQITLQDTIISKMKPSIIEGENQTVKAGEKKELVFCSNAEFADFIEVRIDGKTLDSKNYTSKEGSTIVTLKADYVSSLSAGTHTIGIVSDGGVAETTFIVQAKSSVNTSDQTYLLLWGGLMLMSAGLIAVIQALRKYSSCNNM